MANVNPQWIPRIMSGEDRSFGGGILRSLLSVGAVGYGCVVAVRNGFYNRGWLRSFPADVPVVSLGNLTTGGTGKTPLTAWLVTWCQSRGWRPAILSRGYRALPNARPDSTDIGNDEKKVLDQLCPGVPHLQNRDRVAAARLAVAEHDCQVLILDDGFQHRRLRRTLDLVVIDALNPWGHGALLPRGLLREPVAALKRADAVIISRADLCNDRQRAQIIATIQTVAPQMSIATVGFQASQVVDHEGTRIPWPEFTVNRIAAFCGIGNPTGFHKLLETRFSAFDWQVFPDHHYYTSDDLRQLVARATVMNAEAVLTTQKDFVKIAASDWTGPRLWFVEIAPVFLSGQAELEALLKHRLGEFPNETKKAPSR